MNSLEYLIKEKKILSINSYITINGDREIYRVNEIFDNYLKASGIDTKHSKNIKFEEINTVDSMSIQRLADAYSINDEMNQIIVEYKTDVDNDIFCKKEATLNDIELEDGMKIILQDDRNKKYNGKLLTVRGVGNSIKLVGQRGRPKKS